METKRPKRTYLNHHLDSTVWDRFSPRNGDIIISTSYKSGTTWTQSIVRELVFYAMGRPKGEPPDVPLPDNGSCPWLDARFVDEEYRRQIEEQKHRRFIKTHLPIDGLPYYPQVRYLVVARDPRDVFMSLWNHYSSYNDDLYAQLNNDLERTGKPLPRCPDDVHDFWNGWISRGWFPWEREGYPFWGNMYHTKSWWEYRHHPNVSLHHYSDMLEDPADEIQRMARFLSIDVSERVAFEIIEQTALDAMRNRRREKEDHQKNYALRADVFFFKGTNGRWRGLLSDEELEMYEHAKRDVLTPNCARWLEEGRKAVPLHVETADHEQVS